MADKRTPYAVVEFHLKQIIEEKGLSVKEVSERTGISRNGIYVLIDHLPKALRLDTIARLCAGLDVLPADLLIVRTPRVS